MGTNEMHDKIVKLIAKAEGTDNPHEAEIFMAKAEELMVRYGIEKLATPERQDEKIIHAERRYSGLSYARSDMVAGYRIIRALGLEGWYRRHDASNFVLVIVGFEQDVQDGLVILDSLRLQGITARNFWWKSHRAAFQGQTAMVQLKEKRTFTEAFGEGAGDRIRAMRERVVNEQKGTGTELAIIDRSQALANYMAGMSFRKGRRGNDRGSYAAGAAGRQAGRNADVGARRVSGGGRALEG